MFSTEFFEIVHSAKEQSDKFYSNQQNAGKPNPYYIGFGTPNAKVLIMGKEKGFDPLNKEQLQFESIGNPHEWFDYLKRNKGAYASKYDSNSQHYMNAYYPYTGKMKPGHTWTKYANLARHIFPEVELHNNDFLNYTFISEINHQPSRLSAIRTYNYAERLNLLRHGFYRSFPTTILACGSYLKPKEIEDVFDVRETTNFSKPRQRMLVFTNQDRILINVRQLSMDVKHEYLELIAKTIKEHHEKNTTTPQQLLSK